MTRLQRFCENGEVRIEYLAWAGTRQGLLPAVLVPGMACPASYWAETSGLVERLGGRGARTLVAVSLRGRGGSACPEKGWTPEHHHSDVLAVLAAEGIARCHLVGHSVGGAYALGLALSRPALAATVTMGDYPPFLPFLPCPWVERLEASKAKTFHPDFPRRLAAESVRVDYAPELGSLEAPLLVVQGTGETSLLGDDKLLLFGGARRLEVVQVAAGHDVFLSDEAQEACAAFLARNDA